MENQKEGNVEKKIRQDFEKQIELSKQIEALKEETYQKLKNDPEVLEFLAPYNSFFYESFFETYATDKATWYVFKDKYQEDQEEKTFQFQEIAKAGLELIQKKKMYDLRREWGAGSVDFPDMKTPFDFMEKCDDVFALDWVSPISVKEVAILKAYIKQTTAGDLAFLLPYEAKEFSMPFLAFEGESIGMKDSFSKFYDAITESTHHVLPDKRGQKAQFYLLEYNRVKKEEDDAKIAKGEMEPPKEFDTRPYLPTRKSWFLEEFIKKFDTKETWYNYQIYKSQNDPLGEDEDNEAEDAPLFSVKDRISTVLYRLENLDVVLPVKENADWRAGLIEAYNEYERQAVLEAVDQVYEEYLFHVENGIQYISKEIRPTTLNRIKPTKEKVEKGRELLGETGEMDFR